MGKKNDTQLNTEESMEYFPEIEEDELPDPTEMDFEKVKSSYFGLGDWTSGLPDASKVNDIIREQNQKKERERILGVVHTVLYILFFSGITLCMAEYGSARTTDMEFFYSRLAMIFFLGVVWSLQRVKLFNWQSLVLSLAFAPYAVFYPLVDGKTSTNVMIIVVELITRWMLLMLLADIAINKKIRQNQRFHSLPFAILCVTAVFSMMNGKGGFAPVIFCYFLIMCFITVSAKEWEKLTDCMIFSGMLTFAVVTVFSFTGNPMMIIPRDFYMFTDDIGQFYALCLALATYAMLRFAKKYGHLSFPYFLSIFWIIATVVMILNKGTTGIIPGVLLMFFVIFLFGPKMGRFPFSLVRPFIVLCIVAAIVVGNIVFFNTIVADNFDTSAFAAGVMKSPLQYFANVAEELIGKVDMVHRGGGGYGKIIQPKTFAAYLNVFLDSRIGIFFETIGALNWDGHILVGVNADSFVMATKNQYIQYLYEFGYFGGALNILFYVSLWITSVVLFVKQRKERFLLPLLLGGMTLGVWINVSSGIFYPLVFFYVLSLYPVLVDLNPGKPLKKAKKSKKSKKGAAAEDAAEGSEKKDTAEDNTEKDNAEKNTVEGDAANDMQDASDSGETDTDVETDESDMTKPEEETEEESEESEEESEETEEETEEPKETAEPEEPKKETKKEPEEKPVVHKKKNIELLPEEKAKPKKHAFREEEGRPLDRKQLEDEAIISISPIVNRGDSADDN